MIVLYLFRPAILRRHQLINYCSLLVIVLVDRVSDPYSSNDLILDLNILSVVVVLISFSFHTFLSAKKPLLAVCIPILIYSSVPPPPHYFLPCYLSM